MQFYMETSIALQFEEFKRGFSQICSGDSFSFFRPEELQILIQGADVIDIGLLKEITTYQGFTADDQMIKYTVFLILQRLLGMCV